MLIDRAELTTLIPHAGRMCLLDGVVAWDERSVTCVTRSHLAADNPLRAGGRLAGLNAIEYGAQAAAVHGGLIARRQGRSMVPGYLAGISEAVLAVPYLDEVRGPLTASAYLLQAGGTGVIYQVVVAAADRLAVEARVSILNRPEVACAEPGCWR
jgi:predicted hotdog family 3-hydroxylacyl-ACP dehydratase